MKFKKLSSLVLAATLGATVLTGCSSSNDDTKAKGENGGTTELVWYMIGTPQPDQAKVLEEMNKYTAEKIGVTVDLRMVDWGDYGQKMQVITSSGEPYDICFASDYALNAQKGAYLEITDEMLDKNAKELKEAIDPLFLEGASINGKLYGIPANKEVGQQMVWAYNAKMAKDAGVDMTNVKTLEDLEPVLEKVKAKNPDLKMPMAAGEKFMPYMPYDLLLGENLPFAISLEGDSKKVVNLYEQDDVENTLKTLRRYYQKGLIHPQAATDTDPHEMSVENWFVRKEQFAPGAGEMWSSNAGYEIGYTAMHDPLTINNSVTGSVMSISATSQNPDEAMKYLNLLNTDEYLRNLVDRGIKDVHYTENEDGTITKTDAAKGYNMPSWALGNVFITKSFDTDPKDRIEQYEKFNEGAVASPTLGFYVDTTEISNEIASISNIVQEFKAPLFTGTVDTEKQLGELNKKLKAAGLDKVMENIQAQYDKWMADNK
ncbi:MAG: ABC transporter substrate-binding protein [Paraclostridium sp.]